MSTPSRPYRRFQVANGHNDQIYLNEDFVYFSPQSIVSIEYFETISEKAFPSEDKGTHSHRSL